MESAELIKNPQNLHSHIVLLGAGASRAAFGEKLPLMDDLVKILNLEPLLKNHGIDSSDNFELIYSDIKDNQLREIIEQEIYHYFSNLSLPNIATHYDRLLLSLRDLLPFTFNSCV